MFSDFSTLFSWFNMLAMLGWALLLFSPKRWTWLLIVSGIVIPVILGVFYGGLMLTHMSSVEGGGYSSLAQVRALMNHDPVLLAGWAHYLSFDLIVATLIAQEADKLGIHRLIQVPILLATFMYGPVGLVLFVLLRLGWQAMKQRRNAKASASLDSSIQEAEVTQ